MRGLYPEDIMYRRWKKRGRLYEEPLLRKIQGYDRRGVYVDCGANVGNHTVFFAMCCPSTRVIGVEAHRDIYRILQLNVKENVERTPVSLINAAVTDDVTRELKCTNIRPQNVGSTQVIPYAADTPGTPTASITLDTLLQGEARIAVLKLDVEGGELAALRGASWTLRSHRPLIAVEAANRTVNQATAALLQRLNYRHVFTIGRWPKTYLWEPPHG